MIVFGVNLGPQLPKLPKLCQKTWIFEIVGKFWGTFAKMGITRAAMHRLTSNNGHYVHKNILYLVVFVFRTWKWRKSAHFYVARAGWQKTTFCTAKCAFFVNQPVQRKNELISVTFTSWKQKPPDTGCFLCTQWPLFEVKRCIAARVIPILANISPQSQKSMFLA